MAFGISTYNVNKNNWTEVWNGERFYIIDGWKARENYTILIESIVTPKEGILSTSIIIYKNERYDSSLIEKIILSSLDKEGKPFNFNELWNLEVTNGQTIGTMKLNDLLTTEKKNEIRRLKSIHESVKKSYIKKYGI
jgi:hypothetical protein